MTDWISITDHLPLTGWQDPRYDAPFHEEAVQVLVNGTEQQATFWACWEETTPDGPENSLPPNFLMEFDVEGVTHWRR